MRTEETVAEALDKQLEGFAKTQGISPIDCIEYMHNAITLAWVLEMDEEETKSALAQAMLAHWPRDSVQLLAYFDGNVPVEVPGED